MEEFRGMMDPLAQEPFPRRLAERVSKKQREVTRGKSQQPAQFDRSKTPGGFGGDGFLQAQTLLPG